MRPSHHRPDQGGTLAADLKWACARIFRAAKQLDAEDDTHEFLAQADPKRWRHLAERTCEDIAQLLTQHIEKHYDRASNGLDAPCRSLAQLRPSPETPEKLYDRFARRLNRFDQALHRYADKYERFARMVADAPEQARQKGEGYGRLAVFLAMLLLGPLAPIAILILLLTGRTAAHVRVRRQLEKERAKLRRSIEDILDVWDTVARDLRARALTLAEQYRDQLKIGVREQKRLSGRPTARGADIPLALPYYPDRDDT